MHFYSNIININIPISISFDKLWKCQINDDLYFVNSIVRGNIDFSLFFIFFKKKIKLFFQLLIYIKIKKSHKEMKIFLKERIRKYQSN